MSITWNRLGYSFVENATVNANLSAHAVKSNQSNTGGGRSANFPNNCNIQSIEVFFTTSSGSPTTFTCYLARDSVGDVAITPGATTGATQSFSTITSSTGSCVFEVNTDFNFDSTLANCTEGTIYAVMKVDTGTVSADVRVNWRA